MSTSTNQTTNTTSSNSKMLTAMVSIGAICALLIVLTYESTLPRINQLKAEALAKAIYKVLPGAVDTRTFQLNQNNGFDLLEGKSDPEKQSVYAGYDKNGKLIGIAVEASGQGYADIIRVLYGYDPSKEQIIGFYVLESKETPGLGDKIEKDASFLNNFYGLDVSLNKETAELNNQVLTVKNGEKVNEWEIDGITGATISSRAIGDAISSSTNVMIPLIYNNKEVFIQTTLSMNHE